MTHRDRKRWIDNHKIRNICGYNMFAIMCHRIVKPQSTKYVRYTYYTHTRARTHIYVYYDRLFKEKSVRLSWLPILLETLGKHIRETVTEQFEMITLRDSPRLCERASACMYAAHVERKTGIS